MRHDFQFSTSSVRQGKQSTKNLMMVVDKREGQQPVRNRALRVKEVASSSNTVPGCYGAQV